MATRYRFGDNENAPQWHKNEGKGKRVKASCALMKRKNRITKTEIKRENPALETGFFYATKTAINRKKCEASHCLAHVINNALNRKKR